MGDRRFDHHWEGWDARLRSGETRLAILKGMTEAELAELLGADAGMARNLERNIVATELGNRLARRGRPDPDLLLATVTRLLAQASRPSTVGPRASGRRAKGATHRTKQSPGSSGGDDDAGSTER